MESGKQDNGLYGCFHLTVEGRELSVEPNFSNNQVYYRVCEGDNFLFTLQLDDNAQWVADDEEMDPVGTRQPIDNAFARKVGDAIEKLKS